jgi:hypothetical protein
MNELFISCSMEMGVMLEATSDMEGIFYNMSGTVPRFTARRSYRHRAMLAGLGFMLLCLAIAVALAIRGSTEIAPYVAGAGALAYFVSTIVAMIPQAVTLEVAGTTLTPSWRRPIEVERVEIGAWVVAGVDAASGVVATVRGRGGALRIGGEKHAGEGYQLGAPSRSVDCQLPAEAFDELTLLLGVTRGEPGPLVVPLVRSSQSFAGVLRQMAPWLATITLLGIMGLVVGNSAWGEQLLATPEGSLGMAIASGGLAILGIGWMVVRGRRIRSPELELCEEPEALIIRDRRGGVQRVPWRELAIEKQMHSVSSRVGTFAMPVLILTVPGRKPLRLGAWDTQLAWPGAPAKTWRAPSWIVGSAQWPALLDALKRHGRL